MDSRLERERDFHNERFEDNAPRGDRLERSSRGVTHDALNIAYEAIRKTCQDATILDYGCSLGETTFICVRNGAAFVHGIDISDVAIAQAQEEASNLGISNVEFAAMNAEALDFPDKSFDLVCGFGILHHLNIGRSCAELSRVLKKTGRAVFLEPLGHNPAINLFRRLTPGIRTPDEHPLLMRDIHSFERYFETVDGHYVNLTTLATVPLSSLPGSDWMRRRLASFDQLLFRALPVLRRYAWNVVLDLSRPIQTVNSTDESSASPA